jgi:hypothetical protein
MSDFYVEKWLTFTLIDGRWDIRLIFGLGLFGSAVAVGIFSDVLTRSANASIEPLNRGRWRRTQRRFCSDECKWDAWAIRRLKERLNVLSNADVLKVIRGQLISLLLYW